MNPLRKFFRRIETIEASSDELRAFLASVIGIVVGAVLGFGAIAVTVLAFMVHVGAGVAVLVAFVAFVLVPAIRWVFAEEVTP